MQEHGFFVPQTIAGCPSRGQISTKKDRAALFGPLCTWWAHASPSKDRLDMAFLKAAVARAAGVEKYSDIRRDDIQKIISWLNARVPREK